MSRSIFLSFPLSQSREIHPLSPPCQGTSSPLPLHPQAPAQSPAVSPPIQRNSNGKEERKTDQKKWKFKLLFIDRRNYAKKRQMEEENQDRQKSSVITEHEATPAQNHRLAQELAVSPTFIKTQEKHSPITLPSLLPSTRSLIQLQWRCSHELHPPTPRSRQPQLTAVRLRCSPPPSMLQSDTNLVPRLQDQSRPSFSLPGACLQLE